MEWNRFNHAAWRCGVTLWLMAAASCFGAETDVETEPKVRNELYVGVGAVVSSKPYVGMGSKVYPVPVFGYESERLYLRGITGGYRLVKQKRWSVSAVLRPRLEGYDESDSDALDGMHDRRPTLNAGFDVSWRADWGLLSLTLISDILGEYDGQELEFTYHASFKWAGFDFFPSAGLRWKSSDLVGYYYGVESDEVRPGRPAYNPDDAISPFLRLGVTRKLSERWGTLVAIQYAWLDSEARDSPIVEDSGSVSLLVGLAYSF